MSTYLDLCNVVILEGGFEMTPLSEDTWDSADAGRRRYPHIKRAVNSAWTNMQIERNEWEFKNEETTILIHPRFMIDSLVGDLPVIGDVFVGEESQLTITVVDIMAGSKTDNYYLDFTADGQHNRVPIGEIYRNSDSSKSFVYRGRGAYRITDIDPMMREPLWSTFIGYQNNSVPMPIRYIPWENWLYKEISYTTSTRSAPAFISQDYKGDLVFYPQTLSPVNINFVYTTGPQQLVLFSDVPSDSLLPFEYHEWISWEALELLARYDKNPDMLAYAQSQSDFYRRRAERNLMPVVRWSASKFNNNYWPVRGSR